MSLRADPPRARDGAEERTDSLRRDMRIGLIGSGNMARALARGWGEPVLCTDAVPGRADALAAELGGEALASNVELAQRSDVVILCHKPAQLAEVAAEIAGDARAVVSILGGVPHAALAAAYPGVATFRFLPSTPVEVRRGVSVYAPADAADPELEAAIVGLFERVGIVVRVPEEQIDVAMAVMSCAPAFISLVVEAEVDAAVRQGLPADVASRLATASVAGTAALLEAKNFDTLAVRRTVTSPGGSTARGLAALEAGGLRAAFDSAVEAVVHGGRR